MAGDASHGPRAQAQQQAAEAAAERRQRRLEVLAQVTLALSQQLDPDRLLQQITDALATLTGAHNVVLWELDRAAGLLTRRAWTTDPSIGAMELPTSLTMAQGGTGWIARHREPLFVEDIATDERIMAAQWALSRDLVAFCGVPVAAGEELLGVLSLNLKRGRLPQGGDRTLLPSFAAQAAVAMRNARLFADNTRLYERGAAAAARAAGDAGPAPAGGQALGGGPARLGRGARAEQPALGGHRLRPAPAEPRSAGRRAAAHRGYRRAGRAHGEDHPEPAALLAAAEARAAPGGHAGRHRADPDPPGDPARGSRASAWRRDFAADVARAEGDAHQLQQVVLNLILNAEQAILGSGVGGRRTGDHIRITTSARQMGDATWVIMQVADNGPGIPPRCCRASSSRSSRPRRWAMARGSASACPTASCEQHGGRLSVESEPGRTVFTLELPAPRRASPSRHRRRDDPRVGAPRGRWAGVGACWWWTTSRPSWSW